MVHYDIMKMIKSAVLAWLIAVSPVLVSGQVPGIEAIRSDIRAHIQSGEIASVSVAVAQGTRLVWQEAFGLADREQHRMADTATMYWLASVSKSITATALMTLVRDRKIDLDHPINEYLGRGKVTSILADPAQATVRRVATHTAGLPVYHQFFYDDHPDRPAPIDDLIAEGAVLTDVPGEGFVYSNLGYGLLSHIIETSSGRSFTEYVQEAVAAPLGLTRLAARRPSDDAAVRYDREGKRLEYESDTPGAADIWGSASDVARFGMFQVGAHPGGRLLLPDSLIAEMQRPAVRATSTQELGFGWIIERSAQGQLYLTAPGGAPGASTAVDLVPARQLVVVVLASSRSRWIYETADRIRDAVIGAAATAPPSRIGDPPPLPSGTWAGFVRVRDRDVPVRIRFTGAGAATVALGDASEVPIKNLRMTADGHTNGSFAGTLPSPSLRRSPYTIALHLKERAGVLGGALIGFSQDGGREYFEIPYSTVLRSVP